MIVYPMGALLWVLGYGVAAAGVGLALASQERKKHHQSGQQPANEVIAALQRAQHARLTTDAGEEIDVFLAKSTGR